MDRAIKRLFIFLLFIAIFVPPSQNEAQWREARIPLPILGGGAAPEGPSYPFTYTEDCSDVSDWTTNYGNFSSSGGNCTSTTTWGTAIATQTTNSIDVYRQWVKFYVVSTGGYSFGPMVRRQSGQQYSYHFKFTATTGSVYISSYGVADNTAVGSAVTLSNGGNGKYYGAEVEDTGTDTIFRIWSWASDPGQRENWGTPDGTVTDDPATECNTFQYAGFAFKNNATTATVDNIAVGSVSE